VKNNLFILIFFLLLGCSSQTTVSTNATLKTSCPIVLFSSEHNQYITGNTKPITTENIRYRAEINNYAFNSECSIKDNVFQAELSLLFVVKSDLTEESSITLPFYVAILNANDEVVDMQYYQVDGDLMSESENANYIETELTKTIKLQIPIFNEEELNQNKVVVGFMLD
ncbi:uncharacterized protein METZ01_LOCUS140003, partial [marine metagenome]